MNRFQTDPTLKVTLMPSDEEHDSKRWVQIIRTVQMFWIFKWCLLRRHKVTTNLACNDGKCWKCNWEIELI